jgi:hypothetical protein
VTLRQAAELGGREALAAFFGVPKPPSLGSIDVKMPKMDGMPKPGKVPSIGSMSGAPGGTTPAPSAAFGTAAGKQAGILDHLKLGFNVGIGASNMSTGGTGSVQGEPADGGRRTRSQIDRFGRADDEMYATSDSPAPGAIVSP